MIVPQHVLVGVLCLLAASVESQDPNTSVGVIILSRHGVRTPYGPSGGDLDAEGMKPFSNKTFPTTADEWGVNGTAQLTPHGALAIQRMGEWFATVSRYAHLIRGGCENIGVLSDTDTRDVKTSAAFLKGLVPQCNNILIDTDIAGPLFNQGQLVTGECTLATKEQTFSLIGGIQSNGSILTQAYIEILNEIQDLVGCCDPSICNGAPNCTIPTVPVTWLGEFWDATSGPVSLGGYFGSFFLLEALNNMTFAWGNISLDRAVDMNELQVEDYSDVDNWWSARSFASSLGAYIVGSLEQMVTGKPVSSIVQPPNKPFLFLAAHDTNIILMRRLLDIEWINQGWRHNSPPPGGMLIFELHKHSDSEVVPTNSSKYFVRMFFETATPIQIREATQFTQPGAAPPSRVPIALPGCSVTSTNNGGLDCDYNEFKQIVLSRLEVNCVIIGNLSDFVRDNLQQPNNTIITEKNEKGKVEWWWVLVAGLSSFVLAWVMAFFVFRSSQTRARLHQGEGSQIRSALMAQT